MNENWLDRTQLMIGKENVEKLKRSSVLIAGVGGVGGIASEMLCRAGIGRLSLIDADTVDVTNLNRQAAALLPGRIRARCRRHLSLAIPAVWAWWRLCGRPFPAGRSS